MHQAKNQKRRIGVGVAALAAFAVLATSAPQAQASQPKPLAATANGVRTAGGKLVYEVDGKTYVPGQPIKGRHVTARAYLPRVKFAGPITGTLVANQTTTFDLPKSNQRFLQAKSARLVPGWNEVKLELKCASRKAKCTKLQQLDFLINAQPIGADRPGKWLGTYPHYTGKQLLGAAFVKVRCLKGHPRVCRKNVCHRKEG